MRRKIFMTTRRNIRIDAKEDVKLRNLIVKLDCCLFEFYWESHYSFIVENFMYDMVNWACSCQTLARSMWKQTNAH